MSDKVLGNDPFAELGMLAPATGGKKKSAAVRQQTPPEKKEPSHKKVPKAAPLEKPASSSAKKAAAGKAGLPESFKKPKPAKTRLETAVATEITEAPATNQKLVSAEPLEVHCRAEKPAVSCCNEAPRPATVGGNGGTLPFLDFVCRNLNPAKVGGIQNIPADAPAILVCNRATSNIYDALLLRAALRHNHPQKRIVVPLMEDFMHQLPLVKNLLPEIGMARACTEDAAGILCRGGLALVFLEGMGLKPKPYSRRHELQRFSRGGFIKTAIQSGAAIIPLALTREGGGLLSPGWRISIGQAIELDGITPPDAEDAALLNRLAQKIRAALSEMLK